MEPLSTHLDKQGDKNILSTLKLYKRIGPWQWLNWIIAIHTIVFFCKCGPRKERCLVLWFQDLDQQSEFGYNSSKSFEDFLLGIHNRWRATR